MARGGTAGHAEAVSVDRRLQEHLTYLILELFVDLSGEWKAIQNVEGGEGKTVSS